jgi:hypothetical protein
VLWQLKGIARRGDDSRMTDQSPPAWAPPAPDASLHMGIPLAPPANYPQSLGAPSHAMPAPQPGWASAAPPRATPVVDGPAPMTAIPAALHPGAGGLAIDGSLAMPQLPAQGPAPAVTQPDVSFDPTLAHADQGPVIAGSMPHVAAIHGSPDTDASTATHAASAADVNAWWSVGSSLVVAMAAIAWQLVATYARERLPARMTSGQPVDNFDTIVNKLPLAGGAGGQVIGLLLVIGAGFLLYSGWKRGVRDRQLQASIGVVAALALIAPLVLIKL